MNGSDSSYELSFEKRPDYLYARIEAVEATPAMVSAYLAEIAERCVGIDQPRVIIDRHLPNVLSEGDLFFVATEFVAHLPGARVAIVDSNSLHEPSWEFAKLVSANRGVEMTVTKTVAEAEKWLLRPERL